MQVMRKAILAALLAASSLSAIHPAYAAPESEAVADPNAISNDALAGLEELFASVFDTSDAGPIDPDRLALAQVTTARIMPDGIYAKIMNDLFDPMLKALIGQPGGMSDFAISLTTGVDIPEGGWDEAKRRAITDLLDPNNAQRAAAVQTSFKPMFDRMAQLVEPAMREGLARAYARRFSAEQLTELNGFFATPTGGFYAAESFVLQADPEVMQAVLGTMPKLIGEMTNVNNPLIKDLAAIPEPRKIADLSAAEKDALAALLGTTADKLQQVDEAVASDAVDSAQDSGVEGFNSGDPFANETGAEPWWDRTNWAAADQEKIAALEEEIEQARAAYQAHADFETQAMLRTRERYRAEGWQPEEPSEE